MAKTLIYGITLNLISIRCCLMNLTKSKNISAMKLLVFDIETCLRSGGWRNSCKNNKYLDLSFKNSNLKPQNPNPQTLYEKVRDIQSNNVCE